MNEEILSQILLSLKQQRPEDENGDFFKAEKTEDTAVGLLFDVKEQLNYINAELSYFRLNYKFKSHIENAELGITTAIADMHNDLRQEVRDVQIVLAGIKVALWVLILIVLVGVAHIW